MFYFLRQSKIISQCIRRKTISLSFFGVATPDFVLVFTTEICQCTCCIKQNVHYLNNMFVNIFGIQHVLYFIMQVDVCNQIHQLYVSVQMIDTCGQCFRFKSLIVKPCRAAGLQRVKEALFVRRGSSFPASLAHQHGGYFRYGNSLKLLKN